MTKNPILSELYEIRSRILAEHPAGLREFLNEELRRLKAAGHPVARVKQRTIRSVGTAQRPLEDRSAPA